MLIASLKELSQVPLEADGLELRLDLLPSFDVGAFLRTEKRPVILTLRSRSQGGQFAGSEEERKKRLLELFALNAAFLDVEYDTEIDFPAGETKIIRSYHDFEKTPEDLDAILAKMPPAYAYKIATKAHSTLDALRMLVFVKEQSKKRIIGICMGEEGQITRILGPIVGSLFTYTGDTAPGQLTLSELIDIYHYRSLNPSTAIYGLIGDPVIYSNGHIAHNAFMRAEGLNAVYVKMRLTTEELPLFFELIKKLPFQGLSVTMPLKEQVFPYLQKIDPYAEHIGAVNTIVRDKDQLIGYNTDGKGALDAIEAHTPVKDKLFVVLGTGGAAKAIAYEAKQRGAHLLILGRTLSKAQELARQMGGRGGELAQLAQEAYAILVNTTPSPLPIDPSHIRSGTIVMDIDRKTKLPALLQHAQEKGCTLVYGDEMWENQAAEQRHLWFKI
jgi:3-dehydroquinate dehydratase/shikimate dehydrogenase